MTKVRTDTELIEKFLNRGVEEIYPSKEALREKLLSGQRIKVYQGFDPTGPYLHVGHAMGIRALHILQQLGHEVIFLIGDFTAKVGDPDKDKARKMLTDEQIEQNMEGWKKQASQLIDFEGENPVVFKRNFEWLSKLGMADLIELMSNATVQQMIERDMFERRLKAGDPIGLQEFIYPLMQGFDGVAMEVDMEIGGADQTFNMLMGRNLSKSYLGKEKFVRTNQMMDAPDGRTMSKTKGNGINLADSSFDMYGKAMSYPDSLIIKGLTLLTDVPEKQISEIEKMMENGTNPMEFKKLMAFEVVKTIRGEQEAEEAQKIFENTVQKKSVSEDLIQLVEAEGSKTILEFLKSMTDGSRSANEIRRMVEQGGVEVDGEKVSDINKVIEFKSNMVIKFGKREFYKIK
jgi:tyrosyl-tRNA synthetase